ncbi:MAG: anaerobic ribonucleoside-triphosphate reductase activating protein [Oscillospiraceae bacterium]|nr:anaerobic ribonucleoside-triphosphate reductase activating protein [Oscillospiraceae bacterium]
MFLSGLQKLTLLDYPGKVACTVFTAGCNLRCPFCHNAGLVLPERLYQDVTEDDVFAFLKKRTGILDGVAITGGEPLLHAEMPAFLRKVKSLGFLVKLDTNGSFPDRLEALIAEGLVDRVAMDIKNAPSLYAETAGIPGLDLTPFERSKNLLLSGTVDYEFRTTVVKGLHTKESLIEAARWIAGAKEYYLQQFKDSGDVIDIGGLSAYDEKEMHALADAVSPYIPGVQVRGV